MKGIRELIEAHEHPLPNPYRPRDAARDPLEVPLPMTSTSEPKLYEAEIYNYLIAHKDVLGIRKVFRLKNASADGEVELLDGSRVLVEIKYRMNWQKACQAGWQLLESFNLMEPLKLSPTPNAGLVFFQQFSGDWNRKAVSRHLKPAGTTGMPAITNSARISEQSLSTSKVVSCGPIRSSAPAFHRAAAGFPQRGAETTALRLPQRPHR